MERGVKWGVCEKDALWTYKDAFNDATGSRDRGKFGSFTVTWLASASGSSCERH